MKKIISILLAAFSVCGLAANDYNILDQPAPAGPVAAISSGTIDGVTITNSTLGGAWQTNSCIELGLSLVDQGYSPAWSSGGGVVNQITGSNVLQHALRRAKMPCSIYYSAGKAGDTVAGALSRWPTDVAARNPLPGTVWYLNGGNDINTVSTAADIETILTTMQSGFAATWSLSNSLGTRFILQSLPDNGTWSARRNEASGAFGSAYYRYMAYWRWNRYEQEFARRQNIRFVNLAAAYSWPDRQIPKTCTSISVTSNVVTATCNSHGFSTGDVVYNSSASDATWLVLTGIAITNTGSNTFTYPFTHANGSAAQAGAFNRSNVLPNLWSDSPALVHFNPAGAVKGSNITYETLTTGEMDTLVFTEGDSENIVGAGIAAVTDQNVLNRGMMEGTAGTKTGTAVSHTGNVGTGWNSDVVSGNPTAVTLSQVERTEPGRVQMQDQQISIQASGANCEYRLRMAHALPTDWTATAAKSVGDWVSPTVGTGLFYVAVVAGTTSGSQPTWPTTPGDVVTDGTVKWEARRGWINNAAEQYRLGAEYTIVSLSSADALLSMSYGLFDESTSANSILDGSHVQNAVGPGYIAGENGFFSTPAASIPAGMTAPTPALKLWVKAGSTVVIKFGRASWYRATLTP